MISFAQPAMLWSLLALVMPITIHLLSRKEGKVIPLGSLKHIQETSTQQFRGIRLNEILLLLLRCAIIVLLSLMLSGLSIRSAGKEKWVLVEPGAEQLPAVKNQIDSLIEDGFEAHWLAEDFPLLIDSIKQESFTYHHLLENVKTQNLEQAVVFSFSKASRLAGGRMVLPESLKWITVPVKEKNQPVRAVLKSDSVFVRWISSDANRTQLETRVTQAYEEGKLTRPARIKVFIKDSKDTRQNEVMKAVIAAIDESSPFHDVVFSDLDSAHWIIWLSEEATPETDANILQLKPQTTSSLLIQKQPRIWNLTKNVNEEIVLNEDLLTALASLILKDPSLEQELIEIDQRVSDAALWGSISADEIGDGVMKSAMPWLFIALILVILLERLLSYQRQQ